MAILFKNNASTKLAYGITAAATSMTVLAETGNLFPAPGANEYFLCTLVDDLGNKEIVKVTFRNADVFTIVRAQEGTTARAFNANSLVENRLTAGALNEVLNVTYASDAEVAAGVETTKAISPATVSSASVASAVTCTGNAATATRAVTADACSGNAATATTLADGSVLPTTKGGTGVTSLSELSSKLNVSPFPPGTRMLFQQSTAPTGWTKDTTVNDKALRVVSGAVGSGGSVAFSTLFGRTATDGTTLTVAQMPSHGHVMNVGKTGVENQISTDGPYLHASYTSLSAGSSSDVTINNSVQANGGNGSHTHGLDLRLAYVDIIIATKA